MEKRRFLLTFGFNLDHSNIDHLVKERLAKHRGGIQEDYFNTVLQKGADLILNYQIIDTNFDRISSKYYLNDYHITEAQKNGFMYSLVKLKGTHVWCNPRIQGHAFCVVDGIEFSFYVYRSINGTEYRFPQYYNDDSSADMIVRSGQPRMPEDERYLAFPAGLSMEEKDGLTIPWIRKLIDYSGVNAKP